MAKRNFLASVFNAFLVAVTIAKVRGAVITITAGDDTSTKSSEVIGSSVVTSVSIILGDGLSDQTTEPFSTPDNGRQRMTNNANQPILLTINSVPIPDPTTTTTTEFNSNNFIRSLSNSNIQKSYVQPQFQTSSPSSQLIIRNKSQRKDEVGGVQNVIQTLKTIVQEEQQKHDGTSVISSN